MKQSAADIAAHLIELFAGLQRDTQSAASYLQGAVDTHIKADDVVAVVATLEASRRVMVQDLGLQQQIIGEALGLLRLLAVRSDDFRDREARLRKTLAEVVAMVAVLAKASEAD